MGLVLSLAIFFDVTVQLEKLRPGDIRLAQVFTNKTDFVVSAALSPDGKYLLLGRRDGSIIANDFKTGDEKFVLSGHSNYVYQLFVSRSQNMLASASYDGTIRLWDLQTFKEKGKISTESPCYGVSINNDYIVVSCLEKILVYDAKTHKVITTISQDSANPAFNLIILEENIWVPGTDGNIKIFNAKSGKQVNSFLAHNSYIVSMDSYGGTVVTAGLDKKIKIWNSASTGGEKLVKEIETALEPVYTVNFSTTARYILASGINGIEIFDKITGAKVKKIETTSGVPFLSYSDSSGTLVGVGSDNQIRVYDKTGKEIIEEKVKRNQGLFGVNTGFSEEGILISGIIAGSQAERLGVKQGGIIVEIDGKKFKDSNELINYITKQRFEGDELFMKVKDSEGKVIFYKVRLGTPQSMVE